MTDGKAYSALIPPARTLNSSIASVEGVIEVAPSSYSVMSNPSRNHPPANRLLPLMRRPTRVARMPWPPVVISDPPGVNTTPGVNCASCQNARPLPYGGDIGHQQRRLSLNRDCVRGRPNVQSDIEPSLLVDLQYNSLEGL